MKKNWVQIVSLVLNVVLLAGMVFLGAKVENLHAETMRLLNQMTNEVEVMQERVGAIRETQREQTEFVEDYSFEPAGVSTETQTLDGTMKLTLRRWAADTTVDLLATVGGESRTFPMTGEAGQFSAAVHLPIDLSGELRFEAVITSQGETCREDVTGYGSLSMLLPLQYAGNNYSGPKYRGDVLEVQSYAAGIEKKYGTEVVDPVFRVLKNGAVVQEVSVTVSTTSEYGSPDTTAYAPDTEGESFRVDCEGGDTVEIHLVCRDSFGLSYEFLFGGWTLNGKGVTERVYPDGDSSVQIFWNN